MDTKDYKDWFSSWFKKAITEKDTFNRLDAELGDGDFGDNITQGAEASLQALDKEIFESPHALLQRLAFLFMESTGGTSGIILGSAFLEMSRKAVDTADLTDILQAGSRAIQTRGKASLGDKTMLDMWEPLTEAYTTDTLDKREITKQLERVKTMQANKGRAADYDDTTLGKQDPGALAVAYLFEALLKFI